MSMNDTHRNHRPGPPGIRRDAPTHRRVPSAQTLGSTSTKSTTSGSPSTKRSPQPPRQPVTTDASRCHFATGADGIEGGRVRDRRGAHGARPARGDRAPIGCRRPTSIRRHPPLRQARRRRPCVTDQPPADERVDSLFREYASTRSRRVRNELVERHMGLASHIARRFSRGAGIDDDVRQVAMVGLVKAVDRFDPSHGAGFSSFAGRTIEGEIKRHFRDKTWVVRVPRSAKELTPVGAPRQRPARPASRPTADSRRNRRTPRA